MKTPEEYIAESVYIPEEVEDKGSFTDAEQAFIEKYLGMGGDAFLAKAPRFDPRGVDLLDKAAPAAQAKVLEAEPAPAVAAPVVAPPTPPTPPTQAGQADQVSQSVEPVQAQPQAQAQAQPVQAAATDRDAEVEKDSLRQQEGLQLVSFLLDSREMALPIQCIQEVIRFVEPTKLPSAPAFVSGVINLRGKVTPLLNLRALVGQRGGAEGAGGKDRFIVVCRHKGLQVGLIVTAISTMYRPAAKDIEWNIEAQVGISSDFVSGLMKKEDKLINILSIDHLVDKVIAR